MILEKIDESSKEILFSKFYDKNQKDNRLSISNFQELCRMCHNKPDTSLIVKKHKNELISNFSYKSAYEIISDDPEELNRIIYPCQCMIPIHIKCLTRLIMTSQNLKCEMCNVFIIFKAKSKMECCRNLIHRNFIYGHVLYILAIIICILISVFFTLIEFTLKFLHIKYILSFFSFLLTIFIVILYIKYVYVNLDVPVTEKLVVEENNLTGGVKMGIYNKDYNLNMSYSFIGHPDTSGKNSAKIFYSFLKLKFDISKIDVLEYRNDICNRRVLKTNSNKKIINVFKFFNSNIFYFSGKQQVINEDFEINQDINKEIKQEINQEINREINHEINQEIDQEINREIKQENSAEIKLDVSKKYHLILNNKEAFDDKKDLSNFNNVIHMEIKSNPNILTSSEISLTDMREINNKFSSNPQKKEREKLKKKTTSSRQNIIQNIKTELKNEALNLIQQRSNFNTPVEKVKNIELSPKSIETENPTPAFNKLSLKYMNDKSKIEELDSINFMSRGEESVSVKINTNNSFKEIPLLKKSTTQENGTSNFSLDEFITGDFKKRKSIDISSKLPQWNMDDIFDDKDNKTELIRLKTFINNGNEISSISKDYLNITSISNFKMLDISNGQTQNNNLSRNNTFTRNHTVSMKNSMSPILLKSHLFEKGNIEKENKIILSNRLNLDSKNIHKIDIIKKKFSQTPEIKTKWIDRNTNKQLNLLTKNSSNQLKNLLKEGSSSQNFSIVPVINIIESNEIFNSKPENENTFDKAYDVIIPERKVDLSFNQN